MWSHCTVRVEIVIWFAPKQQSPTVRPQWKSIWSWLGNRGLAGPTFWTWSEVEQWKSLRESNVHKYIFVWFIKQTGIEKDILTQRPETGGNRVWIGPLGTKWTQEDLYWVHMVRLNRPILSQSCETLNDIALKYMRYNHTGEKKQIPLKNDVSYSAAFVHTGILFILLTFQVCISETNHRSNHYSLWF